jgi:hypothetical protein
LARALATQQSGLTVGGMGPPGWVCTRIQIDGPNDVQVRYEARPEPGRSDAARDDWVEIFVYRSTDRARAFHVFDHCVVRYRGHLAAPSEARRAEVASLVMGIGAGVDAMLAAAPERTIAEAFGRKTEAERLVFGADALLAFLAPRVVVGQPVADAWALEEIFPASRGKRRPDGAFDLLMTFAHPDTAGRLVVVVGPNDPARPAFARTRHFALSHYATGEALPAGTEAVCTLVAFAFEVRDHDALEVAFPSIADDVASDLLALPSAPPEAPDSSAPTSENDADPFADAVNLAISSDCGQACNFCASKALDPPFDGGADTLAGLLAVLSSNRALGVRAVRVNGFDPLAFSRILEVLTAIRRLGYSRAEVFSPCTRLADATFCRAVIDALPTLTRFYVPLYGATAAVHDAVVNLPGAHARVTLALDNLQAMAQPGQVVLLCALTRPTLPDLVALRRLADARGLPLLFHLPYANTESRSDPYMSAAASQTEVARAFADAAHAIPDLLPLRIDGLAPCVAFRELSARNIPLRAWLDIPPEPPTMRGTEYRNEAIRHQAGTETHDARIAVTVPCPHREACALRPACPAELLRSYLVRFGEDEFRPVHLRALLDAASVEG